MNDPPERGPLPDAGSLPADLTVVVAMLTYRRPDDLPDALAGVMAQLGDVGCVTSILVVDNDPEGGAMPVAARYTADPVTFVHEPQPGIAAARNRALSESGDLDILIFIDDDERPEPGWLRSLLVTWNDTRPAAVVGPVVSSFPEEPEPFIAEGNFFRRRRLPTGTEIDVAATNNLLLDLAQVRRADVKFDERFGISGGSDALFTRLLHRRGGRLVWCAEAMVVDVVPPSRLNREWVLRRAFRTANLWSRISLDLEDHLRGRTRERLTLTARGLTRIVGGVARLSIGCLTRSVSHRANGARTLARGLGMTSGAWGYLYSEYRRAPGA